MDAYAFWMHAGFGTRSTPPRARPIACERKAGRPKLPAPKPPAAGRPSSAYDASPYRRVDTTIRPMLGFAPLARLEITTPRLRMVAGDAELAAAVCEFQRRNRRHFARWDPPTAEAFFTLDAQSLRVQQSLAAFHADTGYRYWLIDATRAGGARLPSSEVGVIGSIHFSQVSRGAFQSAMLGYALDEAHVGRGLMTEALQAALQEMFSPRVNLHRVQASYRPENLRSGKVLERLGFHVEGVAPGYLYIDGAWRDHRVTSLLNPGFARPDGW